MKAIWKFELKIGDDVFIQMPPGDVLRVDIQRGVTNLWALVDTGARIENRHFKVVGTGHKHAEDFWSRLKHVGSFLTGDFVWHVFEVVR